jgi:thiol-disulfide isomerase/thioredoxin
VRVFIPLISVLLLFACGGTQSGDHGAISELSTSGSHELCEHEVPGDVCTRCNPELISRFREVNDWCGPHRVPESQCHRCHSDLDFSPMPEISESADIADLTDEQALEGLLVHAAEGKVTVVDFHAAWCAACFNLERDLRARLQTDPDLAVRRIDVGAWEGPVVDRYLSNVARLPFVVVISPDGRIVAELSDFDFDELEAAIEEAGAQ